MSSDLEFNNPPVPLIREFSRPNFIFSIWTVAKVWLMVGLCIYCSYVLVPFKTGVFGICIYFTAICLIATRQHGLGVLTHEGVHYGFSKNRPLNDWLTRIFVAFPFLVSLSKYRMIHWMHHRDTYQKTDPDVVIFGRYPLKSSLFRKLLIKDIFGRHVWRNLKYFVDVPFFTDEFNRRFLGEERAKDYQARNDIFSFYLFWIILLSASSYFWGMTFWAILIFYWIVPYATLVQVILRLRGAIEHGNVPHRENLYQQTRTYIVPPMLQFLFSPYHVNYHLEHHLYPTVCWKNLERLHQHLKDTEYVGKNPFVQTFSESLRSLTIT